MYNTKAINNENITKRKQNNRENEEFIFKYVYFNNYKNTFSQGGSSFFG